MTLKKTTLIYSAILLCSVSFPALAQNNATVPLGNITGSVDMKRDPTTTRAQTMGRSDINVTTQSDDFDYEYDETFDEDDDIYTLDGSSNYDTYMDYNMDEVTLDSDLTINTQTDSTY